MALTLKQYWSRSSIFIFLDYTRSRWINEIDDIENNRRYNASHKVFISKQILTSFAEILFDSVVTFSYKSSTKFSDNFRRKVDWLVRDRRLIIIWYIKTATFLSNYNTRRRQKAIGFFAFSFFLVTYFQTFFFYRKRVTQSPPQDRLIYCVPRVKKKKKNTEKKNVCFIVVTFEYPLPLAVNTPHRRQCSGWQKLR